MELNEIKEIAQVITRNFSESKLKAFVFGSTARLIKKEDADPDEYCLDKAFNSTRDLDLLFEVDSEVFQKYAEECYYAGLTCLGRPHDPMSMYWEYHSPAETRWEAIKEVLNIDSSSCREFVSALNGRLIDIIFLPFEWGKNEDIMEIINSHDSEFSKNIQKDRKLLFER